MLKECGSALEKLAQATSHSVQEIVSTRDRLVKEIHQASESAIAQVKEHEAKKAQYLKGKVEQNIALKKVFNLFSLNKFLF